MMKAVTKLSYMDSLYTRRWRGVHSRAGDIHAKGVERSPGAFEYDKGMLFGLDRHAAFPLYDGSREQIRRALRGGVAQLVRAAES